jgi:hypothetical protein
MTAADICTKLNRQAKSINANLGMEMISPSHVDYMPPIQKIQKTIDNFQRSIKNNMSDIELVHQWLEQNKDIIVHPKDPKDYPTAKGKY